MGIVRRWDIAQSISQVDKSRLADRTFSSRPAVLMSQFACFERAKERTVAASDISVYSIAAEKEGLWVLVGGRAGSAQNSRITDFTSLIDRLVRLFTVRIAHGICQHTFSGHTNLVSAIRLLPGEQGAVSASWDGSLMQWDLNVGGGAVAMFSGRVASPSNKY